ncbi:hypothetical protein Cni_G17609 [Canna indica]|uniref:MADS-box domain-containing protein n=1 Tax=Canna indica TaxID=4628 RepID=A0AAQ3QDP8_9LILI|nr:hypothetical protein Cni_G17609 [Canna indica]
MPKAKLDLVYIVNDSMRRSSYKKRKKGLVKKVSELATLCDVSACMILYGPQEDLPEVWPSEAKAARVVARLKSMPAMDQCRKMVNQEGYLRERTTKQQDQFRRLKRDTRELEVSLLMHELLAGCGRTLLDVGVDDATSLALMADAKLKAVQEMIMRKTAQQSNEEAKNLLQLAQVVPNDEEELENPLLVAMEAAAAVKEEEVKNPWQTAMESLQRQNWLVDAKTPEENSGAEEVMPLAVSYDEYKYNYGRWIENDFRFN